MRWPHFLQAFALFLVTIAATFAAPHFLAEGENAAPPIFVVGVLLTVAYVVRFGRADR